MYVIPLILLCLAGLLLLWVLIGPEVRQRQVRGDGEGLTVAPTRFLTIVVFILLLLGMLLQLSLNSGQVWHF